MNLKNYILVRNLAIIMIFLGLVNNNVFAKDGINAKAITSKVTFNVDRENEFKATLISYTNHLGEHEVRIEAAGIPRFAANINPLLGFGRDTDQNGLIDTWFFITKNGIDRVVREGKNPKGIDVLGKLLESKYPTKFSMYVTSATSSILSYFLLAGSASHQAQEEFYRDWMDLEEMRTNFEKDLEDMGTSYTYDQIMYHYQLSSIGYKEIANRMDKFAKKSFAGYAAADIALWVSGGIIFEWGGKVLTKMGAVVSTSTYMATVMETFLSFIEKQKSTIDNQLTYLKEKMQTTKLNVGVKIAEKELVTVLTVATWKSALKHTLKSQQIKQRIRIAFKKTFKWPLNIAKAAGMQWKYIAMNSSVQIGSETFARWQDIKDDNPGIVAKNLLSNSEVQENMGFMAAETILMTGISKNLTTTKARFMASGAVALTNSSIMNFAIKDEADLKRVGFDTAWETFIGNAQVQLDLKGLEYFEKLALKKQNPKIKLVGYVIALVDMGVGYVTYSKMTSGLSNEKGSQVTEPKIMLLPVLAEMP
jgi:hypothetical protein